MFFSPEGIRLPGLLLYQRTCHPTDTHKAEWKILGGNSHCANDRLLAGILECHTNVVISFLGFIGNDVMLFAQWCFPPFYLCHSDEQRGENEFFFWGGGPRKSCQYGDVFSRFSPGDDITLLVSGTRRFYNSIRTCKPNILRLSLLLTHFLPIVS